MAAALATYYFKFRRPNCSKVDGDDPEKKRPEDSTGAVDMKKDVSSLDVIRRYRWEEIQRLTLGFSSTVIGQGGFSTVYLAKFTDHSDAHGAVKVHRESERLYRAFKRELEVLLHVRHDNIVRFIGYCDEGEQGTLVFEYVSNGTLHDKLHGGGGAAVQLSWSQRMLIAYELARAVDYLHEKCHLPIVHNDIKPSNVLLDERLNCKLCDFGSAKMGFSSTVLPNSSMTSPRRRGPMVGSPGYVDPHYLRTGIVSKKSDVYSYGVVVLELMTGMEAFCSEKEQMLTTAMAPLLRDANERVNEVIDPRLAGGYDVEEATAMVTLAASCVSEQPSLRPSMAEILRLMDEKLPTSISTRYAGKAR